MRLHRACLIVLLLLLFGPCHLSAQDATFAFDDFAKNIPGEYERGIRAKLRTLKDRNISIYAANAPATVATSFILSEGEKKAQEYDMVFYIGVNQAAGNKWDYSYRIKPGMEASVLFKECTADFVRIFRKYCPNGEKIPATKLRKIWSESFDAMLENEAQLQAVTSTGQITHRVRVSPYLPVSPALESQIVQFGQLVRNEITKWEQARIIHTAADKVADMSYGDYLAKAMAFSSGLKQLIDDFHRDVTGNSQFKGLYTAGLDAGLVDQYAHFRQIGNYTNNPMYYARAHKILQRELLRGKTPAALKELAALENTLAYHDLYDLYVWLGHEDWLAIPRATYKEGTKWKQKATNNYKFNTLLELEDGEGAGFKSNVGDMEVGFELLSLNVKREMFKLSYDNDLLPLKYKMIVACASLNGKATLKAYAEPKSLEKVPNVPIIPEGQDINNANRSHIFHYPANFFTGLSGYHYYGASTGTTMANVSIEQVWAGKMVFENGGRSFDIGADGSNLALHTKPGAELTILASTVGKGFCYGMGVHDFTGVPATLPSEPLVAIPDDSVQLKRVLLSFERKDQPTLGDKAKAYLDGIIDDIKTLHNTFGKGATVRIRPLVSGFWNENGTPLSFTGSVSSLDGNNAVTHQNLRAVRHAYPQVESYLQTALINAGVPVADFKIVTEKEAYLPPADFATRVNQVMETSYDLEHQPKGWRLVLVTLGAPL